jgi:hypothetical protein
MAKFGLFERDDEQPILTYDGDYMRMEKAFVIIYRYTSPDQGSAEQTANIHLDKGQSVKKLSD